MAEDKMSDDKNSQSALIGQLREHFQSKNAPRIKAVLAQLCDELLQNVGKPKLEEAAVVVEMLIEEYSTRPRMLASLANLKFTKYNLSIHSVNVMTLTLCFCLYVKYHPQAAKTMGVAAILHDVGKTQIDPNILNCDRRLTDEEFEMFKTHTVLGANMLRKSDFKENILPMVALEHHEKLDGSGYPNGIHNVSMAGQIIGLADSFEEMTINGRPYRKVIDPFDSLSILRRETEAGKYSKTLFRRFAYSIAD
ncbi:HD domain-containing protein [bacterium]|nr:HD domain-containing protein [bacterium]